MSGNSHDVSPDSHNTSADVSWPCRIERDVTDVLPVAVVQYPFDNTKLTRFDKAPEPSKLLLYLCSNLPPHSDPPCVVRGHLICAVPQVDGTAMTATGTPVQGLFMTCVGSLSGDRPPLCLVFTSWCVRVMHNIYSCDASSRHEHATLRRYCASDSMPH